MKNKYNITYQKIGDYNIPNLILTETEKGLNLGKYGKLRLHYLKEHKKAEYHILLMHNSLRKHLLDTDEQANAMFDRLMKQYQKQENITEDLKMKNQLEWVGRMNNAKNRIEEIIFKELIYI